MMILSRSGRPTVRAFVRLVSALGLGTLCVGASCDVAMEGDIAGEYTPEVIMAQDAAESARECAEGVGTPEQVEAAQAAAEAADEAAQALRDAMDDLERAYRNRLRATEARANTQRQMGNLEAEILELGTQANLAQAESGVDHNILRLHTLGLPPEYNEGFTNARYMLVATSAATAERAREMAQRAFDSDSDSEYATPEEVAELQSLRDEATTLAASVAAANERADELRYDTPADLTQRAVREAYRAMEFGFRARALGLVFQLREKQDRFADEAEAESQANQAYEDARLATQTAERVAADAADVAYLAAVGCGITTPPIVPGSPEWNETYWEISSPGYTYGYSGY